MWKCAKSALFGAVAMIVVVGTIATLIIGAEIGMMEAAISLGYPDWYGVVASFILWLGTLGAVIGALSCMEERNK